MTRMSTEKRNQVVLVVLMIATLLAGLYFGLIRGQQSAVRDVKQKREKVQRKQEDMKRTIQSADVIAAELSKVNQSLTTKETQMPSGDMALWMINTIRQFKRSYPMDIPQFSSVVVADNTLMAQCPYQQVTMRIGGS